MILTNNLLRMNMKEMEAAYPDRWAVIVNVEGDHIYDYQTTTGIVYAITDTDKREQELYTLARELREDAEQYGKVGTPTYIYGPLARKQGTMGIYSL